MASINRFERLRFERGLTLRQVQEGAGLSYPTLVRIEAGGRITAPVAAKLAAFYGITVAELLGADDQTDEPVVAAA